MSTFGYPDFQKPRDWLAGLTTEQQLASYVYGGAPVTVYTVPAGKTMVLTYLEVSASVFSNAAAPWTFCTTLVRITNGTSGAGAAVDLCSFGLYTAPGGADNGVVVMLKPVLVKGGAAGNPIVWSQNTLNVNVNDGALILYGAQLN